MDPQADPANGAQRVEYVTRWGYRYPGPLWLIGLLVVPILFAAGATVVDRGKMEKSLTDQSLAVLDDAGLGDIHVVFEARDATLQVPFGFEVTQAELDRAATLVEGVEGVRVVQTGAISP